MRQQQLLSVLILIIILAGLAMPASAQGGLTMSIDAVNSAAFPQVDLMVTALDERGYLLPNLTANFSLTEDGQPASGLMVNPLYEHPLDILIAVDTSNTMGYQPAALELLKGELKKFSAALPAQDKLSLMTFNSSVSVPTPLGVDRTAFDLALSGMVASGNTLLNQAIVTAGATLATNHVPRPVIILIADSKDSGESRISVQQGIDTAVATRAVVHVIAWGGAKNDDMKRLADLTHGLYQGLDRKALSASSFESALTNIRRSMDLGRLQYKITYPSQLPCDGGVHELRLRLDHLNRQVEAVNPITVPECTIQISLPDLADGSQVGGKVLLAPRFNRPESIDTVQFLLDDAPLDSRASPPFEYAWDSATVVPGPHTLSLVAKDKDGNTTRLDLNLVVTLPLVTRIISPSDGASLSGPINIQADITSTTKISKVVFLVDQKEIGSRTDPPFELNWNSLSVTSGAHELVVRAEDVSGYTSESKVRFSVNGPGSAAGSGGGGGSGLALVLVAVAATVVLGIPIALRMRRSNRANLAQRTDAVVAHPVAALSSDMSKPKQSRSAAPSVQPVNLEGALTEIAGLNPGQIWKLPADGEIRLGRKRDENDIPLQGASASRRHALIRWQSGTHVIFALKPDNPILINGVSVVQQQSLQDGDRVMLGESEFEYRC